MKNIFLLSVLRKIFNEIQGRGRRVIMLSTMTILLTGIIAFAGIPGANGVIYGCYNKNGDSSLRIIDSTAQCKANEIALNFNQTGPQGLQGLQGLQGADGATGATGPAGANGTSEAYIARQTNPNARRINFPTVILSKNVPAGSYVINAKVEGTNIDGSPRRFKCELSTGDISIASLNDFGETKILALQDTVTFDAPATINLICGVGTPDDALADRFVITAIKVDVVY